MADGFIAPNANTLLVQTNKMNEFKEKSFSRATEKLQGVLKVFGTMTLNKNGKFESSAFEVGGLFWGPEQACSISTSGVITIGSDMVEPCALEAAMKICNKLDSCWNELANYQNGTKTEEEINAIWTLALSQVEASSTKALFEAMLLANFHEYLTALDGGTVIEPDYSQMSEEDRYMLNRIKSSCAGMLHLIGLKGTRCLAFTDTIESNQCTIDNLDIAAFFDKLSCCASASDAGNLGELLPLGFQSTEDASPIYVISGKMMQLVTSAYANQNPLTGMVKFTRDRYPIAGGSIQIYQYLGVPIVSFTEINAWDKYYKMDTLFGALTTTGNLVFGTSYADVPSLSGEKVAWTVYKDPNPLVKETVIHSVVLTAVKINDPKAIVWDAALLPRN